MKRIYQRIAKEDGISVTEVKKEMQDAIENSYKKKDKTLSEMVLQKSITYHGEVPTVDEFIEAISHKFKYQEKNKKSIGCHGLY